jgi:hypothetical protein
VPLSLDELERRIAPALLGQQLFPADYPTNSSIAGAPVSANSATWISAMAASRSHLIVDWGAYTPGSGGALYSMPYNVVHSKDTVNYTNVKVYINNYPNESDISGTDASHGNRSYVLVPMPRVNPQNMFIEGDAQNGPDATRFSGGGSDSHLIVWDADTNTDYEFWEASRPSESSAVPSGYYNNAPIAGQWNAANDVIWHMSADSFRTLGYTSGDAAGLPILNNVIRPDEVLTSAHGGQSATPVVDHALRFTLTRGLIGRQFTYPASHVAGGAGAIPYGARFRLKNDTATNSLIAKMGPESQVIAHALQQYGLILADIGSSMFVQGAATSVDANNQPIIDPTTGKPITWDMSDLMPDAFSGPYTVGLDSIPTSDFEAVDLTPRVIGLSATSGTAGDTITITGVNFSGAGGNLSVLFVPAGNNPPYTSTPAYPNSQTTALNSGVVAASSVTIVDDQHLQVVVPSGPSGTVDIQILSGQLLDDTYNSDAENATAPIFGYGISAANASDRFTYSSNPVAPSITTQPSNQTVVAGHNATFTAAASGVPAPTAQWQVSTDGGSTWSDISGATAATYAFTSTLSQNGSEYRAVFTNTSGSATTNSATLTVNVAPSITAQPSSQTVTAGQTASFTAAASGSPPPTVQWQQSTNGGSTWSNISGATATTYSFSAAASDNGHEYRAIFTNAAGSATTSAATLTVYVAPSITTQPTDQAVIAGRIASFTSAASGQPTPAPQWQVSTDGGSTWSDVSGANAATYSFTSAAGQDGWQYRAVFTSSAGSATTSAATLTVNVAPSVTTQPSSQTVNAGQTASFTAAASGSPPPTVQWQLSTNGGSTWSNISSATANTYTFTTTVSQTGYRYRAVFTNSTGSATTSAATLTVHVQPAVTAQPSSQSVTAGRVATFTAAATGVPVPTAQWQISTDGGSTWTNIAGATAATYSLFTTVSQTGFAYRAVYTSIAGSATTNAATLTVNLAPRILTQPSSQTVNAGQTASFTAVASGTPTPTLQWQVSTNGGWTWTNVPGATVGTYSFTTAFSDTGHRYRAVFSNAAGSATTVAGILTVHVAPSVGTQPKNQTVNAGRIAIFTAAASGSPTPAVQWQISTDGGSTWKNIVGATAASYGLVSAAGQNGYEYHAVFTNSAGSATTNAATLTVNYVPGITGQPSSQTVNMGQMATFTATAGGLPVPTVQWQRSTNGGLTWSNIADATLATYSFTAAVSQTGYRYRAVFTNIVGSAATTAAVLTVKLGIQDDFNRADDPALGSSWTGQAGSLGIQSQQAATTGTAVGLATYNSSTAADVALSTDFILSPGNATAGLVARYSGTGDGNGKMYDARIVSSGGVYTAVIEYVSGGTFSRLAALTLRSFDGSASHTLKFVVKGSLLQLFLDNVSSPLLSVANGSIMTAGLVGIRSQNASFDNFSAM